MKQKDVRVGGLYVVSVSGSLQVVRVEGWTQSSLGRQRWHGTNVRTNRRVTGTAARLRCEHKEKERPKTGCPADTPGCHGACTHEPGPAALGAMFPIGGKR